MSWASIQIVWPMAASASLTLAAMHFAVWLKDRTAWAYLLFFLTATAAAAMAFFELSMMRAETPEQFSTALRWGHVPLWVLIVTLTGFVLLYLRAGRPWLAWSVCALRTFALLLNFVAGPNLNYREITGLRHVPFFGESVAIAEGAANPWMIFGQLGSFLLVIFVVDASLTAWRRGDRRRALVTGGSIAFCLLAASIHTLFVVSHRIEWPHTPTLFFMVIVVAMSYEMSRDVFRAAQIARQLEKSETALRQSERRLDQAAEAGGIGIWEWNVVRDEIWATDRCRALFGFVPAQQIGFEDVLGVLHPDDREATRTAVTSSLVHGGSFECEYRVMLAEGGCRWIVTRCRVETDTTRKPVVVHGVSIDITERKQAGERFRSVVEAAPSGIMMLNAGGRIELVNARAQEYFGYSRGELIGQSIEMLIPENLDAQHAVHRSGLVGSTSRRRIAQREVAGRRKDGSEVPLEIRLNPIQTLDGSGVATLVTMVDIGERKRNEAALWRERAFLWKVIDINPNLIFAKDRQGRFTLANQAVADIYGTTVRALIGKTDADFDSNADEIESFRRADLEVMDTLQERLIPEERITDAAGRVHYMQTVKRPIVGADGKADQVLGSATDITVRKHAELELGRQRNELAHFSRVTMLGQLSGSLAHELNQPLAAILSNAQAALRFMADDNYDRDEVREILQDIVNDDKRAGEVIRGLRLLLKKGEMRREPLDANEVVQDVLRLMRSDILNARVHLTSDLAPALPTVAGDRVQFEQVLLNLVMNGCDAMAGTAVSDRQLVVTTECVAGNGVRVSVADRGPGIPPEALERVFEPFYTTKSRGLGLGLAVCRKIIAAHGGRLWAENNAGVGAAFFFTVPASSGDST